MTPNQNNVKTTNIKDLIFCSVSVTPCKLCN